MKNSHVVLVDAGTGNLHSILHTLYSLGYEIHLTQNPVEVLQAKKVILPGVGAFGKFMEGLHRLNLEDALSQVVNNEIPLLGICVGMQAFFETSFEMGTYAGLGFLKGSVPHFPDHPGLKIPHTGWNQLWPVSGNPSSLLKGLKPGSYAYFNHSYYCLPAQAEAISATTDYGFSFCSMVQQGKLMGVQFHPEKSQQVGAQILTNFMEI